MRSIVRHIVLLLSLVLSTGASAREVVTINRDWKFFTNNETSSDKSMLVDLPHTWNNDALSGRRDYFRGIGNYLKSVDVPASWQGSRVFLLVEGSSTVTDVMLNGKHICEHRGGSTAFSCEITDVLRYGAGNFFWIMVNNSPRMDVMPTAGEANVYGGIYRGIKLIVTSDAAFSPLEDASQGVYIETSSVAGDRVEGKAVMNLTSRAGIPDDSYLRMRLVDADGRVASQSVADVAAGTRGDWRVELPFVLENPVLWNGLKNPYLYQAEFSLVSGNTVLDSLTVDTGFRYYEVTDKGFMLNGEPYPVHGVVMHKDRVMVGPAVTPMQIEEDFNIMREMGANAVRVAGGRHADYFYDLCDQAGVIVWTDLPFTGATYYTDKAFINSRSFKENGQQQLREMIRQLYNHPSILFWGLFSDVEYRGDDPVPYIVRLDSIASALDPARKTIAASNQDGEINSVTDLIVFDHSFGWSEGLPDDILVWKEMMNRKWKDMKYGVSYAAGGSIFQQDDTLTRPVMLSNRHPEGWHTYFHERYFENAACDSTIWSVWVGNMFDFGAVGRVWGDGKGTNDYGMVTFDRKDRKDAYYLYKANWNESEPFVYITEKRRDTRSSRTQTIKVYSNQAEVELLVNNKSVGTRNGVHGVFVWENVELRGGINRLEARSGWASDKTVFNITQSR